MMLARGAKTQARTATKITHQTKRPIKKATHEVALGWLYDGSLSDSCWFKLYCFCGKRGLETRFYRKLLFCTRNFGLLVVNQQWFTAVSDGIFINDDLGNILLIRQFKHDIQ